MRVSASTHRQHGAAILCAAARLFRSRGISAVSISEVSTAAGLTHGAFYGHFASKSALAEAACRQALEASARRFGERGATARRAGGDGLAAIIDSYLTERHRDEPEHGCTIPTLGGELARAEPALRDAFAAGTTALVDVIASEIRILRPSADDETCRTAAFGVLAALAGGIILARAIIEPAASRAALEAAKRVAISAAHS